MKISQPELPDGYVPEGTTVTFLTWESVEHSLQSSLHYWMATTYPDGRPHVVPRWGVWIDTKFWYDGSPETRHVRNLAVNPSCALHLESGAEAVISHGWSHPSKPVEAEFGARLSAEFGRKYSAMGYTPGPDAWSDSAAGGLRCFTPRTIIAWTDFPKNLTRFEFENEEKVSL